MADEKPTPSTPSSQRRWRDASTTAIGKARAARGRRVFHLLIVLMAVLGIFVGWLLFWNPVDPPRFLSFPITQYKMEYWPVNAWAGQDGEALAGLWIPKEKAPRTTKRCISRPSPALRSAGNYKVSPNMPTRTRL